MKPKVIMHTQISLDGCINGFENPELYYITANRYSTDMVLFGSNTVYTALKNSPPETDADFIKPVISPEDNRPFGVIPDSRGRLRNLHAARNMGYLKGIIVLVSETTPQSYLDYLKERNYDYLIAGSDHVDYHKAFEMLYEMYSCRTIRTDSGGILTNLLLEQGLVDEINLVVSPCLAGNSFDTAFRSLELQKRIALKLMNSEVQNNGYLYLTYQLIR